MIDWLTVEVAILHLPIVSGCVVSFDADGEEEWKTDKRVQAKGSFDKTISVKSTGGNGKGQATHLLISGNPSKFLQGHNVFGSDDAVALLYDTFLKIIKQFNLTPTMQELAQVRVGQCLIKMVDINYSYSLPSGDDVLAFIRSLEFTAKTRHGRPSSKGGTLYFGKSSSLWALKFYYKAEEIQTKTGKLPLDLQDIGIETWAEDKLRVELRLKSKQLKRLNIKHLNQLTQPTIKQLFNDYLGRIDMTQQIQLTDDIINTLPRNLRLVYNSWKEGWDMRTMLPKTTYYRRLKELKFYGIDIAIAPVERIPNNIVPLVRILEAKPASIPDFAFEKGLVHHSAARG